MEPRAAYAPGTPWRLPPPAPARHARPVPRRDGVLQRAAFAVLWLFLVTIPLDTWVLPGVGVVSSTVGVAALGAGLLSVVIGGRLTMPRPIHVAMLVYVIWSATTLLWSADTELTTQRIVTGAQLLGLAWLVNQMVDRPEQRHALMRAFVVGCACVALGSIYNFLNGNTFARYGARYSAFGLNPNDLGITLSMGIPAAWFFATRGQGLRSIPYWAYLPVSLFAIMLTGSRGSLFATVAALLVVPALMRRVRWWVRLLALPALVGSGYLVLTYGPTATLMRLASARTELGGTMNSRTELWRAGLEMWQAHPIGGVGAGAFLAAVEPYLHYRLVAHNVFISVAAETGVVGILLFAWIVVAAVLAAFKLGREERIVWLVMILTWGVGTFAASWEYRKATWVLFALVAARTAVAAERTRRGARTGAARTPAPLHRRTAPAYRKG